MTPLDADGEVLKDPFRRTPNVRELLRLQTRHVRRYREALRASAEVAPCGLPETA
jgi:hypothetical protein